MADEGTLREVAQWLDAWEWPVTEAELVSRAADFGWTVLHEDSGHLQVNRTGVSGDLLVWELSGLLGSELSVVSGFHLRRR